MKIVSTLQWSLLVAATVLNGILAGGSLIKSVVELPARRIIGLPAMAAFHRAADLQTGFLIYPALGLGAPAVTIALGTTFALDQGVSTTAASFAYFAAALAAAHVFATTRAAPNLLKLRSGIPEETVLGQVYGGLRSGRRCGRSCRSRRSWPSSWHWLPSSPPANEQTGAAPAIPEQTDRNGRSRGNDRVVPRAGSGPERTSLYRGHDESFSASTPLVDGANRTAGIGRSYTFTFFHV